MDRDINFGSLDRRQLCLRPIVPVWFRKWNGHTFVFHWPHMLSPVRWWRTLKDKYGWQFSCHRLVGGTHRCWCGDGSMIDGRLVMFGFGVLWFYSHYTGEVPCHCDEAIAALDDEEAELPTTGN